MTAIRISIGLLLLASVAAGWAILDSARGPGCGAPTCSALPYGYPSPRIPEDLRVGVGLDDPARATRCDAPLCTGVHRPSPTASAERLDFRASVVVLGEKQLVMGL